MTITAGGNDVGFAQVAAACTANPPVDCGAAVEAAVARIPAMRINLATLIGQVKARAPRAEIYVTGYPILFQAGGPYCGSEVAVVDAANGQLNAAIKTVAETSGATYVDVASEFPGRGLCYGPDSWILGLDSSAPLHPDAEGQEAYADAVEATDFTSASES